MPEPIKFTDEEKNQLMEIQTGYQQVIFDLGRMYVDRMGMEKAFAQLATAEKILQDRLEDFRKKEDEWTKKMAEKYGDGNLDIINGVFLPAKAS